MLDDPGKTPRLLVAVQGVALPFGVHLTPPLARLLREEQVALAAGDRQTVSEVSYLGDEGGIVCHIVPPDGGKAASCSGATSGCRRPCRRRRCSATRSTGSRSSGSRARAERKACSRAAAPAPPPRLLDI